jgi:hypothetical protein
MSGSDKVHANPEDIRHFAAELQKFCDSVEHFDATIRGELGRLGNTFRDDGYEEFCESFAKSRTGLAKFLSSARIAGKDLVKDADALEKYQSVKPRL